MKKTNNTAGNKLDKTGGKITGSLDVSDILTVNGKLVLDEDNCVAVYDGGNLDPNTTLHELILTRHSNAPDADGSTYYYIQTIFYSSKSTTSNRAQVAYGHRKQVIACRYYYNGTWSDWIKQNREITRATYNSTATKSNSTNSWQYMLSSNISVTTEAGKYLCVLSFAIAGNANGIATVRPTVNNKEISTAQRCSIPVRYRTNNKWTNLFL